MKIFQWWLNIQGKDIKLYSVSEFTKFMQVSSFSKKMQKTVKMWVFLYILLLNVGLPFQRWSAGVAALKHTLKIGR